MKKHIIKLCFTLCVVCYPVMAQENSIKDVIPKNWKIIQEVKGDLNKDKKDDLVFIIEEKDPNKIIKNTSFGRDYLNTNPRGIMIFFNKQNKYVLVEKNLKEFIPSENDANNSCREDPLNKIGINNGILVIPFNYWLSCGSWYVNNAKYKFRYQNKKFELIGFEHFEIHRASGNKSELSINFLTKKKAITTGGNEFSDTEDNPKTIWSKIKIDKLYQLENCTENTYFDVLED
ncbi:hypothetical protein QJU23_02880 [Pasteurella atlantica]|uniref:Uncharacterized protein n=2 Tax=Pasteurellaceae TaxID=712 RepID=A0ACC6HKM7_9PAST|nr:hypothetical protein [Pasteurella atlantica]MDP8051369.1 hypothetical protein [Pasteurella atlantica]MDP8104751.1 hypothetical protein [Pasteurella atlantica]MDP8148027.1 hypothetical protein [Pasteurella atlantica]